MKFSGLYARTWTTVYANDLDAWIPEIWAQESLMILEQNLVMGKLVHRDFSDEIAEFGDTVNTRRPNKFQADRKTDTDNVTIQDATAVNVAVKLDQHWHTSFLIRDGEESKGFARLRDEYMIPAMWSISRIIDETLLAHVYQFLANNVGRLEVAAAKQLVIDAREKMNDQLAPIPGRNLVVSTAAEADLLSDDAFTSAERVGDEGTALREGSLGRKFGFDIFMSQLAPQIAIGSTIVTGAVNEAGGSAIGDTTITVDGLTAAITNGSWCTIAGDDIPQKITATVGGAIPTELTIAPGLRRAIVDDAVVTIYTPGAINLAAGHAAGFVKALTVDGFTVAPKRGQLVSIGAVAADPVYGAVNIPTTTSILLDRPLDQANADDDVVGIGPRGSFNFAFHRNALALVNRPLAAPAAGTGALSFVANHEGLSMRSTITYNGEKQGHLVTLDILAGLKVLDVDLGVVVLS